MRKGIGRSHRPVLVWCGDLRNVYRDAAVQGRRDVYRNRALAWKNDVNIGYRGDSARGTQVHFISCLKDGSRFETGGREYLRTYAAVEAAYRSLAERRLVSLAEIIQQRTGANSDESLAQMAYRPKIMTTDF